MLDMWEEPSSSHNEENDYDADFLDYHTSLTHEDLEACGPSRPPLEFPTPVVYEGELADLAASDHCTGVEYALKNVLRRKGGDAEVAYLMKKKLAKTSYGTVRLGVVLRRRLSQDTANTFQAKWQSTGEFVAIKCSSWNKIQAMRGRHLVDPIKEISVLQLIGNNHNSAEQRHVLGCKEVFQDDEFLYTVMPYCEGGELYDKLDISGLQQSPDEEQARQYFRQIMEALVFLQRKGICHRNVSLENMYLDGNDDLVLLDSGLSLRVPYSDPSNIDAVTDVSEGSIRRLMRPQGQCGKLMYLAPEIIEQKPFDGHATDLWAAGITLFIMVVGVAPFGMALSSDKRFEKIAQEGCLEKFLGSLDCSLSAEAIDLLQNMLWRDPRDRLTLADVMSHPWVVGPRVSYLPSPLKKMAAALPQADSQRCLKCIPPKEEEQTPTGESHSPVASVLHTSATDLPVPSSPQPHSRKHRRKVSGARDLIGKLKVIMANKRCGGTQQQQFSNGSNQRSSIHIERTPRGRYIIET